MRGARQAATAQRVVRTTTAVRPRRLGTSVRTADGGVPGGVAAAARPATKAPTRMGFRRRQFVMIGCGKAELWLSPF